MNIGEKIKKIRTFRDMTQKNLGEALGWGTKGANRVAQYETGYRIPKNGLIVEIARVLDVNPLTFYEPAAMEADEIMEILFWIDECNPSAVNLFQLEPYPDEKFNASSDSSARYHDNTCWPAKDPVGLWFNYGLLNTYMREWIIRKQELKSGEITKDEYFEWKINWPDTCDDCGSHEPKKTWRKP